MNKFKKFRKTTELYFGTEKYRLIRTNHLFETRAQDKQRDQFINEDRYKKIITLALQNGLKSFRAKGSVVVVIANSKRKNFSCTSILVCLDEKNNILKVQSTAPLCGFQTLTKRIVKKHSAPTEPPIVALIFLQTFRFYEADHVTQTSMPQTRHPTSTNFPLHH